MLGFWASQASAAKKSVISKCFGELKIALFGKRNQTIVQTEVCQIITQQSHTIKRHLGRELVSMTSQLTQIVMSWASFEIFLQVA